MEHREDLYDIDISYNDDDSSVDEDNGSSTHNQEDPTSTIDFKDSVMYEYLSAMQRQFKKELSGREQNRNERKFLLAECERFFYVLPRQRAKYYCKKLEINFHESAYYQDIHIWLPDVQHGSDFTPACINCKNSKHVSAHAWPMWLGRRFFGLETSYYVMTRRYRCNKCEKIILQSKKNLQYTFMGWDERSLPFTAFGKGSDFPEILTKKSGIDKSLMKLLRASMNRGMMAQTFANVMKEMHSLKYYEEFVSREYGVALNEDNGDARKGNMFSKI